jgi:hypothetical protein
MANEKLHQAYERFLAMYANSHPVRDVDDFAAAVRAAGLNFPEVDDAWLRSLDAHWVYGRAATPFADEAVNRRYRRLIEA